MWALSLGSAQIRGHTNTSTNTQQKEGVRGRYIREPLGFGGGKASLEEETFEDLI